MSKAKTVFVCSGCGYETAKWLGCCPECGEWNSFEEKVPEVVEKQAKTIHKGSPMPMKLHEIEGQEEPRFTCGITELDRVLGGGIVSGSAVLIGGDPGIGKSTLLLQAAGLVSQGASVLYVTGEESARQVKMRANRLKIGKGELYLMADGDVENILEKAALLNPVLMIVDSIQTMATAEASTPAGSISQVRQSGAAFVRYAKESGTAVFLVGHVTKEGSLAGPRILEHMVDAVLYFEGDRQHEYRLLRSVKNRFGASGELGVFEMKGDGMVPVANPSEALLSQRARGAGGSVVFCTLQGSRPILCDLQALAGRSFYAVPKRTVGGMDSGRVALLLAVMEKRAGKRLFDQDVYINVAGGLELSDPAADLAVCVAVASSLEGYVLPPTLSVMGEVGLCGEVRPVSQCERRVAECVRLGFSEIMLPKQNLKRMVPVEGVHMIGVDTLAQALAVVH